MNEESYTETATAAFLSNDIQRPPRKPPSIDGEDMILSGEYYLDAHNGEIVCHQVWTGKTDRGINKVVIWTNQGYGWIMPTANLDPDCARLRWNHAVAGQPVFTRVKSKQCWWICDRYPKVLGEQTQGSYAEFDK